MPIKLREYVSHLPIICDPSHIAGNASLIEDVSQIAMDINLDGLMIETHVLPQTALSDPEQQVTPKELKKILSNLILRDNKLRDEEFKEKLLEFRVKIDMLDFQIINLINSRKKIVELIAKFKKENKLTIFQIERWFEIISSRKKVRNN